MGDAVRVLKVKTDPLFRVIDGLLPESGRVLDLGCGYGVMAHWLALDHPGRTIVGMDLDAAKIEVARASAKANPRLSFEECDLLGRREFPECDAVLLFDVLHYFTRASKLEMLRALRRSVVPVGCVLVRDACRSATQEHRVTAALERVAVASGRHRTRQGLHFESEHGYLELFREAGFGAVQIQKDSGLGSNVLFVVSVAAGTDDHKSRIVR